MSKCIVCGKNKSVAGRTKYDAFCSPECRAIYISEKLESETRICQECGKEFTPTTLNQKFCSEACRYQAKLKRDAKFYEEHKPAPVKEKEKHCKRKKECYYGSQTSGIWYCGYIEIESKSRGCESSKCDKYKPRGKKRFNPYTGQYIREGGVNVEKSESEEEQERNI